MKYKTTREGGYLLVDNRASGGGYTETKTRRCSHCQKMVLLHPERQRPRNWCMKCDSYICDTPACNIECVPIDKILDQAYDAAAKGVTYAMPRRFTS
jgi:hypothetical protein